MAVAHSKKSGRYYAVQVFGRPRSESIAFEIVNQSSGKISYEIDAKSETLEPGFTHSLEVLQASHAHVPGRSGEGRCAEFSSREGGPVPGDEEERQAERPETSGPAMNGPELSRAWFAVVPVVVQRSLLQVFFKMVPFAVRL